MLFLFAGEINAPNHSAISITYIANEGFMIESRDKKILIDALFMQNNTNDYLDHPSSEIIQKMKSGHPPFHQIDLILASHDHEDHFHPVVVIECMKHNPNALFVSTPHVVDMLKLQSESYEMIKKRVQPIELDWYEKTEQILSGIPITIIRTHHDWLRINLQNQMHLIKLGDVTIFHEGDSPGDTETFESLWLENEQIDIAFVQWQCTKERIKILKNHIRPKHIILMHIPPSRIQLAKKNAESLKELFPSVTVFNYSMERRSYCIPRELE